MKCELCGKEYKQVGRHILIKHPNISLEEYYNTYLKKDISDGKCKTCGKDTLFIDLYKGYAKYCCANCARNNPDVINQRIQTRLDNHNGQYFNKEALKSRKLKRLKHYGYTCEFCGKLVGNIKKHIKYYHEEQTNKVYIYCKLCGEKLTQKGLSYHIHHSHSNITDKEYYDLYLKKSSEGKCQKCRKPTEFISLSQGYKKVCEDCIIRPHIIKCPICGLDLKNPAPHFYKKHNSSPREYYDAYLKKPNEGKCIICGEPTSFISIDKGYTTYCSNPRCAQLDPKINEKKKKTCLKRFGVEYNFQKPEVIAKAHTDKVEKKRRESYKTTCIERYGVDNTQKVPEIRAKVMKTNMKRYGGSGFQSPKTK